MSATTDTLLDRLGEVERERDAAVAERDELAEKLDAVAHASALITEHADDLVFVRQLREQLEGLGLSADELSAKVGALSAGPVGKLLGLGGGKRDADAGGPLFG